MRYCGHCNVKLRNDLERCPLCDMETEKTDDCFEADYPYVRSRFGRMLLIKLISFCVIVFIGASLLVDHLVPTQSPWAAITVAALIYAWASAFNVLRRIPNPASVIMCQLIAASALCFVIDYLTGYHKWSVNFVIPFLIVAAALATSLMIAIKPMRYRENTLYQLIIAVLGVLSVLLWVFGYSDIEWPVVTAAFVSILCFFTVLVFSRRRAGTELKKRFHV